jgi:hypothetical protein
VTGASGALINERHRDFQRLQPLTGWSHDEENTPLFTGSPQAGGSDGFDHRDEYASQYEAIRSISITFVIQESAQDLCLLIR